MGARVVDREEAEVVYHDASWGGNIHTNSSLPVKQTLQVTAMAT